MFGVGELLEEAGEGGLVLGAEAGQQAALVGDRGRGHFGVDAVALFGQLQHRAAAVVAVGVALEAAGGVQEEAAELLFIKPTTLNGMIKRYDIRPKRRKGEPDEESA